MRGRDALAITVFVLPASGTDAAAAMAATTLTDIETVGRSVATLAVDTSPFSTAARPALCWWR